MLSFSYSQYSYVFFGFLSRYILVSFRFVFGKHHKIYISNSTIFPSQVKANSLRFIFFALLFLQFCFLLFYCSQLHLEWLLLKTI